jgi:hypothetical protein
MNVDNKNASNVSINKSEGETNNNPTTKNKKKVMKIVKVKRGRKQDANIENLNEKHLERQSDYTEHTEHTENIEHNEDIEHHEGIMNQVRFEEQEQESHSPDEIPIRENINQHSIIEQPKEDEKEVFVSPKENIIDEIRIKENESKNSNSPVVEKQYSQIEITAKSVLMDEKEKENNQQPKMNKSQQQEEEEDLSRYELATTILNYIPAVAYATGGFILSYILYRKFKI